MWIEVAPRPRDFCGRPPCPLCFRWEDGGKIVAGLHKFALDLLGKAIESLDNGEALRLRKAAENIHRDGLGVTPIEPEGLPPADIGMSEVQQLSGWFKERRQNAAQAPRTVTCDEIADRNQRREAEKKAARKAKEERLNEVKEIAKILADAQGQSGGGRGDDAYYLRGIAPGFIDYCRRRGMYDPREIAMRWQQEYQARYSPMDFVTKGPYT